MNEPDIQRIQQKVLERLKRGVRMRSRAYFVGRIVLFAAVSLLVLVLSAYILSFIAFSLHESGEQLLLGFGIRGIETFIILFPWLPAVADIVLILFLEWLLQGFKFGYRRTLLTLFAAVLVVSGALAAAIGSTPLNGRLLAFADKGQLPLVGPAYEGIYSPHHDAGVFRGTITAINGDRVTILCNDLDRDVDEGTWTIVLPSEYATSSLSLGERVFVLGTPIGSVVHADDMDEMPPSSR